jgi:hypothetical protein
MPLSIDLTQFSSVSQALSADFAKFKAQNAALASGPESWKQKAAIKKAIKGVLEYKVEAPEMVDVLRAAFVGTLDGKLKRNPTHNHKGGISKPYVMRKFKPLATDMVVDPGTSIQSAIDHHSQFVSVVDPAGTGKTYQIAELAKKYELLILVHSLVGDHTKAYKEAGCVFIHGRFDGYGPDGKKLRTEAEYKLLEIFCTVEGSGYVRGNCRGAYFYNTLIECGVDSADADRQTTAKFGNGWDAEYREQFNRDYTGVSVVSSCRTSLTLLRKLGTRITVVDEITSLQVQKTRYTALAELRIAASTPLDMPNTNPLVVEAISLLYKACITKGYVSSLDLQEEMVANGITATSLRNALTFTIPGDRYLHTIGELLVLMLEGKVQPFINDAGQLNYNQYLSWDYRDESLVNFLRSQPKVIVADASLVRDQVEMRLGMDRDQQVPRITIACDIPNNVHITHMKVNSPGDMDRWAPMLEAINPDMVAFRKDAGWTRQIAQNNNIEGVHYGAGSRGSNQFIGARTLVCVHDYRTNYNAVQNMLLLSGRDASAEATEAYAAELNAAEMYQTIQRMRPNLFPDHQFNVIILTNATKVEGANAFCSEQDFYNHYEQDIIEVKALELLRNPDRKPGTPITNAEMRRALEADGHDVPQDSQFGVKLRNLGLTLRTYSDMWEKARAEGKAAVETFRANLKQKDLERTMKAARKVAQAICDHGVNAAAAVLDLGIPRWQLPSAIKIALAIVIGEEYLT